MRLQIATPGGTRFALSPDGRKVVFEATVDGRTQLWLRPLESEKLQPLPGTENATNPFWSPDSRSIAFFANAQLKRIDIAGGAPVTLAPAIGGLGATWGSDGSILFVPQNTGPMYRVPAAGGKAVAATRVDPPRITAHWQPFFLPDGRHFLFYALGTQEQRGVYVGALDSNETHRLFDSDGQAVFRPPDLVLHARQGALVAQRLDMGKWEPLGDPIPVADAVATDFLAGGYAAISSTDAGPIAYRPVGPQTQFVWVDRRGNELEAVGVPHTTRVGVHRPSPDNRTVAFTRPLGTYQDVWLISGILRRFTFEPGNKVNPLWSPDGHRIVFAWDREGVLDLYEKRVDGTADPTLLLSSAVSKSALDWSQDGQFILYLSQESGGDLLALPLAGDKKPIELARTPFSEGAGRFSADGRWVAYQSNETGQSEVYLQPFPEGRFRKQITSGGGVAPQWSAGGRELLYVAGDRLMVVSIKGDGPSVVAGKPLVLFTLPPASTFAGSRDGQRFLVSKVVKEASPITILFNWKPE
jgi:Tol biopolymer transport system component